jgi:hypothetical protein
MLHGEKKEKIIEWSARVLLTLHFLRCLSGLVAFWQTKYQLISPLIPPQTVEEITEPYWKASLVAGGTFIIALWLYFFKKRIAAIAICGVSIAMYELLLLLFTQ